MMRNNHCIDGLSHIIHSEIVCIHSIQYFSQRNLDDLPAHGAHVVAAAGSMAEPAGAVVVVGGPDAFGADASSTEHLGLKPLWFGDW